MNEIPPRDFSTRVNPSRLSLRTTPDDSRAVWSCNGTPSDLWMQPNRSVASLGYADTVHIIISCIQSRTGILSRRWEPTASHKNIIDSCCSEVHNCWLYNIRHLIGYHWVIIIWYKWSMIIIVRPPSLIIFGGLMTTGGTGFLLCNRGHPKFRAMVQSRPRTNLLWLPPVELPKRMDRKIITELVST